MMVGSKMKKKRKTLAVTSTHTHSQSSQTRLKKKFFRVPRAFDAIKAKVNPVIGVLK